MTEEPWTPSFGSVEAALEAYSQGQFVVVADDTDRENEGDLIIAAEDLTTEKMTFMIRYTSGMICVSVDPDTLDRLELPMMVHTNTESLRTAYTVTTDYKHGTTTGISSHDRALTIRKLVDPTSNAEDFNRPGHVFPLKPVVGGTLKRGGHTEAGYDLSRLAGKLPGAALSEIVNEDGTMARRDDLLVFAKKHGLATVAISDIAKYRQAKGL